MLTEIGFRDNNESSRPLYFRVQTDNLQEKQPSNIDKKLYEAFPNLDFYQAGGNIINEQSNLFTYKDLAKMKELLSDQEKARRIDWADEYYFLKSAPMLPQELELVPLRLASAIHQVEFNPDKVVSKSEITQVMQLLEDFKE